MRLQKALWIAIVVAVEFGILYADGILFLGFSSVSNVESVLPEKLSLILMCTCDPMAFILSWIKPKIAAIILSVSSCVTLIMSIVASDAHSLKALWFLGGIFWIAKFVLSYVFYKKFLRIFSSPAST